MSKNDNWTLGLIDSAWFGSDYEGKNGREEAKRIGFESLDLFVGFDPGRMSKTNRERYVTENQSAGLPIVSLVCTCLGRAADHEHRARSPRFCHGAAGRQERTVRHRGRARPEPAGAKGLSWHALTSFSARCVGRIAIGLAML